MARENGPAQKRGREALLMSAEQNARARVARRAWIASEGVREYASAHGVLDELEHISAVGWARQGKRE